MAITLNGLALDDALTSVREHHEEVGGRDERTVELAGLIPGETSLEALETRLDAILDAASAVDYSAVLSIRPGRRLMVRRAAFRREIERTTLVGSFTVRLEARDPFEEAESALEIPWNISGAPSSVEVASAGTVYALPVIHMTAGGILVKPAMDDGERCMQYDGVVGEGSVLVFDSVERRVVLDGADVTPYVLGEFPRLAPGETTLTYTDDPASAHAAEAVVIYRDRWW